VGATPWRFKSSHPHPWFPSFQGPQRGLNGSLPDCRSIREGGQGCGSRPPSVDSAPEGGAEISESVLAGAFRKPFEKQVRRASNRPLSRFGAPRGRPRPPCSSSATPHSRPSPGKAPGGTTARRRLRPTVVDPVDARAGQPRFSSTLVAPADRDVVRTSDRRSGLLLWRGERAVGPPGRPNVRSEMGLNRGVHDAAESEIAAKRHLPTRRSTEHPLPENPVEVQVLSSRSRCVAALATTAGRVRGETLPPMLERKSFVRAERRPLLAAVRA
jgi:hypothetical protein